jgi:hypothetical protein
MYDDDMVLPDPAFQARWPLATAPEVGARTAAVELEADPTQADIAVWRALNWDCQGPAIPGTNIYYTNRISAHHRVGSDVYFKVEWVSWPPMAATWEPAAHLAASPDMLRNYCRRNGLLFPSLEAAQ